MPFFLFIRAIFKFILAAAFKKGELSINKSTFNPLKAVVTFAAIIYIVFSLILITKLLDLYITLETQCPGVSKEIIHHYPENGIIYCRLKIEN